MDPVRKRTVRLVVALTAAVFLDPAVSPTQLLRDAQPGRSYQLTGVVVAHSVHRVGETLQFSIADRVGGATAVPVSYTGSVPDPFREGREVIVTVQRNSAQTDQFVGERNSLITKCPSKYKEAPPSSTKAPSSAKVS
jgi:cytochrome c-type biogenesis protein CcmE